MDSSWRRTRAGIAQALGGHPDTPALELMPKRGKPARAPSPIKPPITDVRPGVASAATVVMAQVSTNLTRLARQARPFRGSAPIRDWTAPSLVLGDWNKTQSCCSLWCLSPELHQPRVIPIHSAAVASSSPCDSIWSSRSSFCCCCHSFRWLARPRSRGTSKRPCTSCPNVQ